MRRHSPTEELRVEFALALAGAETKALYITAGNGPGGFAPVEVAARSGRTFAIVIRDDVLAVDCDHENDPKVPVFAADAEAEGLHVEILSSGGRGRHHIYVIGVTAEQHARLGRRAWALGLAPRSGTNRIRPPYSPHRKNPSLCSTPQDSERMLKALHRLGPAGPSTLGPIARTTRRRDGGSSTPSPRKRQPLPNWAEEEMTSTEVPERYVNRGTGRHGQDAGLAVSFYLHGRTKDEFVSTRLTPGTASEKALEMPRKKALRYLADTYDSGVTFAHNNPSNGCPPEVRAELDLITSIVETFEFPAGKQYTLRKVMNALLAKGYEQGRLEVGFSHRALAEASGVNRSHLTRCVLPTLVKLGLLEVAQPGDGSRELGTVWRLRAPAAGPVRGTVPSAEGLGGQVLSGSLLSQQHHAAFDWGAFGASGYETWASYDWDEGRTRAEARGHCSVPPSTHKRRTRQLLDAEALIETPDGRIVRNTEFDFDAYADQVGATVRRKNKVLRHQLDRDAHAEYQTRLCAHLQANLDKAWAELKGEGPVPVVATGRSSARDTLSDEDLRVYEAFERLRLHAAAQCSTPVLDAEAPAEVKETDPETREIFAGEGAGVGGGAHKEANGSLRALDGLHDSGTRRGATAAATESAALDGVADLVSDLIDMPHLRQEAFK